VKNFYPAFQCLNKSTVCDIARQKVAELCLFPVLQFNTVYIHSHLNVRKKNFLPPRSHTLPNTLYEVIGAEFYIERVSISGKIGHRPMGPAICILICVVYVHIIICLSCVLVLFVF